MIMVNIISRTQYSLYHYGTFCIFCQNKFGNMDSFLVYHFGTFNKMLHHGVAYFNVFSPTHVKRVGRNIFIDGFGGGLASARGTGGVFPVAPGQGKHPLLSDSSMFCELNEGEEWRRSRDWLSAPVCP